MGLTIIPAAQFRGQRLIEEILTSRIDFHWWEAEINQNASSFSTAVVANTGSTALGARLLRTQTGGDASSTAARSLNTADQGWHRGVNQGILQWGKKAIFIVRFHVIAASTNGKSRLLMGKEPAEGVGDLDDRGLGFVIDNLALSGTTHDGSSLSDTDLSTALVVSTVYVAMAISDGAGRVEYFLDGVSKATDPTGGPSANSTANHTGLRQESENNADTSNTGLNSHQWIIGLGQ